MAEISGVRTAIQTRLQTVSGLRTSAYPPDSPVTPMAFVGKVTEKYHDDLSGGSVIRAEVILLAAPLQSGLVRGYQTLAGYLARTGTSSIYAALESGGTLVVLSCDDNPIEYAGVQYIAATWQVEVLA